jgi:hypothetical protein
VKSCGLIVVGHIQHFLLTLILNSTSFSGADLGFGVRGREEARDLGTVQGPQRVQGRALVRGPGGRSSGGLRNYRHLFERQF